MARLGPQRRRKYMYMNDKYMCVCVCVCAGLKEPHFCVSLWSLWCAAVCSVVATGAS